MPFREWLYCPECDSEDTGILAYKISIVFECYECGLVEEFDLGDDIPVHQLDSEAIEPTETEGRG